MVLVSPDLLSTFYIIGKCLFSDNNILDINWHNSYQVVGHAESWHIAAVYFNKMPKSFESFQMHYSN